MAADRFAARYLVAVFALSYLAWLLLFDIYRYAIPLEMLAPCAVVACVSFWPVSGQRHVVLASAMLGFMVLTTVPGNWGRLPWAGKMVNVQVPDIARPKDSMIITSGVAPTSFVIPSFPREIPFLRLQSYMVEPQHDTQFNAVARARIAGHTGDIYALQAVYEEQNAARVLAAYALELGECHPLPTNLDQELEFCAVRRRTADQP